MTRFVKLASVCIGLLAFGCSDGARDSDRDATTKPATPVIVVSSYPLYAMTQELVDDAATVNFLCHGSASPRDWKPTAEDIGVIQSADLILLHGAGYERWAQSLSLPRSRTVTTSSPFAAQLLQVGGELTHQHGPKGASDAGPVAWATWLNPELANAQLKQVEKTLCQLLPNHKDNVAQRAAVMADQLETLRTRFEVLRNSLADQSRVITVVADRADFIYLTSALQWELHTAENVGVAGQLAAAVDEFQPQLLLFRKNGPAEVEKKFVDSKVPAVAIDLCEQEDAETAFVAQMTENVNRLEAAVGQVRTAGTMNGVLTPWDRLPACRFVHDRLEAYPTYCSDGP